MKLKKRKARGGDDDLETKVGWRMAALGSETVSHVAAGGLLGWILDKWLGTDYWLMTGLIAGIATGIVALIRGALKMNKKLDEDLAARKLQQGSAEPSATATPSASTEDRVDGT